MKPFKSVLNRELEAFIAHRKGLGYSDRLIRSLLLTFDKYVRRQSDPSSIWNPHFYVKFRNEIGLEPSTVNTTLCTVR